MTAGVLQRHVAIVSSVSSSSVSRLPLPLPCRRCSSSVIRLSSSVSSPRRWQSSAAAKAAATTAAAESDSSSQNEIPASCFVESPSTFFPEPSLTLRKRKTTNNVVIDLATTRPAKLDSPAALQRRDYADGKIPVGDQAKYFFRLGKSYLLFYKTGLKNVWNNWKLYRSMMQQKQGYPLNQMAKYRGETLEAKEVPQISRSEYQLCLRARHDIFKMIPFSLVFLICGEFTPLVIIALGSSIVPYTCRIPRQQQKDLDTKLRRDQQYMQDLPRYVELPPLDNPDWRVEHLEAYRLGLSSIRNPLPVVGPLVHALITRPRLARHCDNIVSDTLLIHREGGPSRLSCRDLWDWADAYGLYALRLYVEKCQKQATDLQDEKRITAELLPKIDAEMKYMLDLVKDQWPTLKPGEQWRIGLRTVGSQSPDWKARLNDLRAEWKQA